MQVHHVSIKTADIFGSMSFYEQLGFRVETRFTAGITLACWMIGSGGRLELIQVPEPAPAPDPFADSGYVGYYHLSLLVADLQAILEALPGVPCLLPPTEQQIGAHHYRIAFIADPDGLPIELMQCLEAPLFVLPPQE